jgi:lysozyme family protein
MYSTTYQKAVETVLEHEGGFVNDATDPGGATNFGVSLRFLISQGEIDLDHDGFNDFDFDHDGDVDVDDIRAMTREAAIELYHVAWWEKFHYDALPAGVSIKTFDLAVNMGALQAHKLLQRACRACGQPIKDDGIIGARTRQALFDIDQWGAMTALRSEAAGFYRALIAAKPKFEKYRDGWLNRAYS